MFKLTSDGIKISSPSSAHVVQNDRGIGNTVGDAKALQADLHHLGDWQAAGHIDARKACCMFLAIAAMLGSPS